MGLRRAYLLAGVFFLSLFALAAATPATAGNLLLAQGPQQTDQPGKKPQGGQAGGLHQGGQPGGMQQGGQPQGGQPGGMHQGGQPGGRTGGQPGGQPGGRPQGGQPGGHPQGWQPGGQPGGQPGWGGNNGCMQSYQRCVMICAGVPGCIDNCNMGYAMCTNQGRGGGAPMPGGRGPGGRMPGN